MILNQQQIANIILNNPQRDRVKKGCDYNKQLRLHIYGEGLDKQMTKIDGYEAEDLQKLRAKYARSNKDLFSRLGRPIDKVFSARGGSIYYNLSDVQDKTARALALNIRNGISIRKWVEMFWKPHFLDDPFGLVFLEILPEQEARLAMQQGRPFSYPTYKSISAVYDYLPKGSGLEYVVFQLSAKDKLAAGIDDKLTVFRVVDDAYDYFVSREDQSVQILSAFTIPNYFGEVPGQLNSDLISPKDEDCYLSLYDDVIELANHFMLKGSIKLTHEFLHGYPKYWEYADTCPVCNGTRMHEGDNCKACNGSGKKMMTRVSDAKLLEYPDKDTPAVAPDVAGYVSPDKTYYEIATADLQMLEELMNITLWGSAPHAKPVQGMQTDQKGNTKTATEVMDDIKPQADRLNIISEMAEKRHKFILDAMIRLQVAQGYKGSSVNYGRRYMIEGPDTIWEKYSEARTKGAAVSVLDDLLIEYYEAKYASDPVKLAIQTKLMKVEPFVHLKASEVDLSGSVTLEDKAAKAYFGEWLSTQNEAMILSFSPEMLREQLETYAGEKAQAVQAADDKKAERDASLKQPAKPFG
jgi:hypothetical protein